MDFHLQFALNIPLVKAGSDSKVAAGAAVRRMVRTLEDAGIDACLTSEHPAPVGALAAQ